MPAISPDTQHLKVASAARDEVINYGLSLCEASTKQGGWAEYFDADKGLGMEDEVKKAHTAVMLENAKRWMNSLDESTLSLTVGGYRDFIFPIVRAAFPNNPINEIVSVQPQTRRNGTIYWLNYIVGQTRGQFLRGQTLFDANNGWSGAIGYTDERLFGESQIVGISTVTLTGTVAEAPVRAGSVELTLTNTSGSTLFRDNGNGGFVAVGTDGASFGTLQSGTAINYVTGAWTIVGQNSQAATSPAVSVNYTNDGEGQYVRAQIDIEMQSAGVQAVRRAIAMRVSMESMQDFQAEFGQDLSQTIITGAAQAILADVGGEVIQDLFAMSGAPVTEFNVTLPSGINLAEHFRDINWAVQQASGAITDATQRGEATFLVVDQYAQNVLTTAGAAGGFVRSPDTFKGQGLVYIGDFNGLRTYRYKYMNTFVGARSIDQFNGHNILGNILVGYKGQDWWDTGYVHAPYQQFYTNGPDERADLTRRQAFAMRYAKKQINANMYKRIVIDQY